MFNMAAVVHPGIAVNGLSKVFTGVGHIVLVCDKTSTITYSMLILQGYSEISFSFSFFIQAILKF